MPLFTFIVQYEPRRLTVGTGTSHVTRSSWCPTEAWRHQLSTAIVATDFDVHGYHVTDRHVDHPFTLAATANRKFDGSSRRVPSGLRRVVDDECLMTDQVDGNSGNIVAEQITAGDLYVNNHNDVEPNPLSWTSGDSPLARSGSEFHWNGVAWACDAERRSRCRWQRRRAVSWRRSSLTVDEVAACDVGGDDHVTFTRARRRILSCSCGDNNRLKQQSVTSKQEERLLKASYNGPSLRHCIVWITIVKTHPNTNNVARLNLVKNQ